VFFCLSFISKPFEILKRKKLGQIFTNSYEKTGHVFCIITYLISKMGVLTCFSLTIPLFECQISSNVRSARRDCELFSLGVLLWQTIMILPVH